MEIIRCSQISDFNKTFRKYYNLHDVRISDVYLYNTNNAQKYHKHNDITEILFIIDGSIKIKIKEKEEITELIVNKNETIIFKPGEIHTVASIEDSARVIAIKYLSKNENLNKLFIEDYEDK